MTHNWIKSRRWWATIIRAVCGAAIFVLFGLSTAHALGHAGPAADLRSSAELGNGTPVNLAQQTTEIGTVDPVAPEHQAGRSRYLSQCSTCHLPVPAAVLPQETWYALITDAAHYGVSLPPMGQFDQQLMWNYLRTYSRANWGSRIPAFRIADSVYFTALHPDITFEQPVRLSSCASCHIQADVGNFRLWQLPTEATDTITEPE